MIELLIVIAIIGIIAAIVLVAVNPTQRLASARDARRSAEAYSILNAVLNYTVDKSGAFPPSLVAAATTTPLMIGSATSGCNDSRICSVSTGITIPNASCVNLGADIVDAYDAIIPYDPKPNITTGFVYSSTATGYYIIKNANNRIEVGSCNPENVATIKVKR